MDQRTTANAQSEIAVVRSQALNLSVSDKPGPPVYLAGHRLRREGRVELPWTQPEKIFVTDDKTNAHFPERQARFSMQPGTWGRPDVDTYSDLTFWIEATHVTGYGTRLP